MMLSKIRTRRRLMGAGLGTLMSSALLNIGCWGKPKKENNPWKCVYELNESRQLVSGSDKNWLVLLGGVRIYVSGLNSKTTNILIPVLIIQN